MSGDSNGFTLSCREERQVVPDAQWVLNEMDVTPCTQTVADASDVRRGKSQPGT